MKYDFKKQVIAFSFGMILCGCSQPDSCIDSKDCLPKSRSVSEAATKSETKPEMKPNESTNQANISINEADPSGIEVKPTASTKEPVYKKAFGIMNFSSETENSDGFEEVISDMGFYLLEAEDALKNSDIEFVKGIDDIEALPVIVNDKTLKTINAKSFMKNQCCGFIVVTNDKEAEFIALAPGETASLIEAYFANK